MITFKEFEVLRAFMKGYGNEANVANNVYENTHYRVFKDVEEVESLYYSLIKKGYIDKNGVTKNGYAEIEPLKVKNAIILAAGGSDISAKSVYSKPKGLFYKDGETLIERQIRQLKEAGIDDITVVVGYKQEMYFFLADKWGVNLEINPDLKKNNIFSLYCAAKHLGSTYICNCDNYFPENPFSLYEYNSYHSTVIKEDARNELVIDKNTSGRITRIYSCAKQGECIYGHAYLDSRFSERLVKYLYDEIDDFRVCSLFWEEFVYRHIDDLDMYVRRYQSDYLYEFDSIQELQNIDGLFLENVSAKVNNIICEVFDCNETDIHDIVILQKGLSNILFTFYVKGEKYIFRYPGDSTSFFIYRKNECLAQKIAAKTGVDCTYKYIDETGVKISKFVSNCKNINTVYYKDVEIMKHLAAQIRKFHEGGYGIENWKEYNYNPIEQSDRLMAEASRMKGNMFELFKKEREAIVRLYEYAERDGIEKTMCHNDINGDNCLWTDNSFDIIDWEFAGWQDPAYDFGRVIGAYDFDDPDIDEILESYFGRPATALERLHWIAYIGIHNWYYVNWALYKESINESSRDWMLFFFNQVKRVIRYALPKYEEIYGKS